MPRLVTGPWITRSVTVPGFGNKLPWSGGFELDWTNGFRLGGSGSQPWHDPAFRQLTWQQRIAATSADHQSFIGNVWGTAGDGADYRATSSQGTLVGLTARTSTDRQFFGTYGDYYSMQAFMSRVGIGTDEWLRAVYAQRPVVPTQTLPLTITEWAALFPDGPSGAYREFDTAGTGLTLHVTWAVTNASPGGVMPTVRRHADTANAPYPPGPPPYGTEGYGWLSADQVAALPVTSNLSDGLTMDLQTEWIRWIESSSVQPVPATITEFQLTSPYNRLDPAMVDRVSADNWSWSAHLTIPQWFVGYDPGYDGDPPYIDGTTQQGGPGVDHVANVALSMSATLTVKQRFVRYVYGTPPLHQTGRPGVLDAPVSFQSALATPQSSPVQGGFL